jgi:AraC-like DNA-binding protein/ActR/RegA family two-component response regulator
MARVLIVDDCVGTREAFSGILRLEGFEAVAVESGEAGLAYAAQHSFDVGLIDLHVPDMSGLDVIKQMRSRGTPSALVVVTAFPAIDSCFDAASIGAAGYVDGPLFGDEIGIVVRQALAGVHPVRHPARHPEPSRGSAPAALDMARQPADARILQVVRIIEAELPKRWSADALARRVGISASRLRHQFTSIIGVPLSRFVLDRRLQKAARIFQSTGDNVQAVARRVGLDRDLPRFRRAFRNRFGMSPSAYRAAFRSPDERHSRVAGGGR